MHILLHWRWSTVWNRPILGYTGHLTSLRIQGATASISHSQVKPRNQLLRTLETTHIWKLATCSYITGSQINNARKKEKEIKTFEKTYFKTYRTWQKAVPRGRFMLINDFVSSSLKGRGPDSTAPRRLFGGSSETHPRDLNMGQHTHPSVCGMLR